MLKRREQQRRIPAAPAVADLQRYGWCRRDAEQLIVVELGLTTVGVMGAEAGRVLSDHVAGALAWEPVLVGAQVLYGRGRGAARCRVRR